MDLTHRKTILQKIPNGLFIVTAWDNGTPRGAVISFLTQYSHNPPLIAMGIRPGSNLFHAVSKTKRMAIHFISLTQKDMAASFFKIKTWDEHSINGYGYRLSESGNPVLDAAPMILETEVIDIIPKGDHHLFICRVVNTILRRDTDTLTMHHTNWHYGR